MAPTRETFCWPLRTQGIFVAALLLFGSAALICTLLQVKQDPPPGAAILVFLALALLGTVLLWWSLERVEVDPAGISWRRLGPSPRRLNWREIRLVRENLRWQCLELLGDTGQQPLQVRYLLRDFARLRQVIIDQVPSALAGPAAGALPTLPATFRRGWLPYAVMGVGGALLLISGLILVATEPLFAILGFALGLFVLGAAAWSWHSLVVTPDRLILRGWLRRQEIPLTEVQAVEVGDVEAREHGITTGIQLQLILRLRNGRTLKLGSFQDETLKAQAVINAARQGRR